MKKIVATVLLFNTLISFAQNYGFESWTNVPSSSSNPLSYDYPNSWNSLNPVTASYGQITCTKATSPSDVHGGNYAVKLVTKTVIGVVANGLLTTGTINQLTRSVGGGVSYTLRPDSIIGWYKYAPISNDSGFCEIQLLGAGGDADTIGYAIFRTPNKNVTSYTRFSLPIVYRNSNPIVKSIWILSSSVDNTTHYQGSTIFFDDIQLGSNAFLGIAIEENSIESKIQVSPNPAADVITIIGLSGVQSVFSLYDSGASLVKQINVSSAVSTIELSGISPGLYCYSISDGNGSILKTGKLIIQ